MYRTPPSPLAPYRFWSKRGDKFFRLDRMPLQYLHDYGCILYARTPAIFCGRNRGEHARSAVSGFQFLLPASSRLVSHRRVSGKPFCRPI